MSGGGGGGARGQSVPSPEWPPHPPGSAQGSVGVSPPPHGHLLQTEELVVNFIRKF